MTSLFRLALIFLVFLISVACFNSDPHDSKIRNEDISDSSENHADTFTINSMKNVSVDNNIAYIPVGYPRNQGFYGDKLEIVWNDLPKSTYTDEFSQPWKNVSLETLEDIFGYFDMHYLVLMPHYNEKEEHKNITNTDANCEDNHVNCIKKLNRFELRRVKIQEAALFKWGCTDEVTPVLKLGKLEFSEPLYDWETIALGSDKAFPSTNFSPLSKNKIDTDGLHNIYENFNGRDLRIGSSADYSIIFYEDGYELAPQFWLFDRSLDKLDDDYLKPDRSIFDGYC